MPTKTPRGVLLEEKIYELSRLIEKSAEWWHTFNHDVYLPALKSLLEEARQEEREKSQWLEKLIEEIGKKMCHFKFLYPNAWKWLIQDMWGWEYQGETLMEVFQAFKKEREKQEKI